MRSVDLFSLFGVACGLPTKHPREIAKHGGHHTTPTRTEAETLSTGPSATTNDLVQFTGPIVIPLDGLKDLQHKRPEPKLDNTELKYAMVEDAAKAGALTGLIYAQAITNSTGWCSSGPHSKWCPEAAANLTYNVALQSTSLVPFPEVEYNNCSLSCLTRACGLAARRSAIVSMYFAATYLIKPPKDASVVKMLNDTYFRLRYDKSFAANVTNAHDMHPSSAIIDVMRIDRSLTNSSRSNWTSPVSAHSCRGIIIPVAAWQPDSKTVNVPWTGSSPFLYWDGLTNDMGLLLNKEQMANERVFQNLNKHYPKVSSLDGSIDPVDLEVAPPERLTPDGLRVLDPKPIPPWEDLAPMRRVDPIPIQDINFESKALKLKPLLKKPEQWFKPRLVPEDKLPGTRWLPNDVPLDRTSKIPRIDLGQPLRPVPANPMHPLQPAPVEISPPAWEQQIISNGPRDGLDAVEGAGKAFAGEQEKFQNEIENVVRKNIEKGGDMSYEDWMKKEMNKDGDRKVSFKETDDVKEFNQKSKVLEKEKPLEKEAKCGERAGCGLKNGFRRAWRGFKKFFKGTLKVAKKGVKLIQKAGKTVGRWAGRAGKLIGKGVSRALGPMLTSAAPLIGVDEAVLAGAAEAAVAVIPEVAAVAGEVAVDVAVGAAVAPALVVAPVV